jgi:hypothetical protein
MITMIAKFAKRLHLGDEVRSKSDGEVYTLTQDPVQLSGAEHNYTVYLLHCIRNGIEVTFQHTEVT